MKTEQAKAEARSNNDFYGMGDDVFDEAFDRGLDAGVRYAESKWNAVSDGLPERSPCRVFVTVGLEGFESFTDRVDFFGGKFQRYCLSGWIEVHNVLAWMYTEDPEPYQPAESEGDSK